MKVRKSNFLLKAVQAILTIFFILIFTNATNAQQRIQGYVQKGGFRYSASSSSSVAQTFPSSTVTVYIAGTTTLAIIYADKSLTPKSNPFVADSNAYYFFYVLNGKYDINFSGIGIITPFTKADIVIGYNSNVANVYSNDYKFSTISTNAAVTIGVKDPIDRELNYSVQVNAGTFSNAGVVIFFTYTNANGETLPSNIRGIGVQADTKIVITSPLAATNAIGWNLYAAIGGYSIAKKQNITPIAIGTSYTLTSVVNNGNIPVTNTTGGWNTITVNEGSSLYAPVIDGESTSPSKTYQAVLIDKGAANEEFVYITSKPTSNSFVASFTKTHSSGFTIETATNGIQEAVMSFTKGGTVIIPTGQSVNSAPIIMRRGVRLLGSTGIYTLVGDANSPGSYILFNSTDLGLGAVMAFSFAGIQFDLEHINIVSNTNGVYCNGIIMGHIAGCDIRANSTQIIHGASGIRTSYGTGYFYITDSFIAGSPAINLYGAFLNNCVIERTVVVPQRDLGDNSYLAEGIVVIANGGGAGGPAGGGFLRLKNITTENGNGSLFDLTDVNYEYDQVDVADWNPTNSPQFVYKNTNGYAISTQLMHDVIFTVNNVFSVAPTVKFITDTSLCPFCTIRDVKFDRVTFSAGSIAIDAGNVSGPFTITNSRQFTINATADAGKVINFPTLGMYVCNNWPAGVNGFDGICGQWSPTPDRKQRLVGLSGISSSNTFANNMNNTVTLNAGVSNIVFAITESDANYKVILSCNANETFWWSNKTTAGFRINSSNAGSTAICDWHIER